MSRAERIELCEAVMHLESAKNDSGPNPVISKRIKDGRILVSPFDAPTTAPEPEDCFTIRPGSMNIHSGLPPILSLHETEPHTGGTVVQAAPRPCGCFLAYSLRVETFMRSAPALPNGKRNCRTPPSRCHPCAAKLQFMSNTIAEHAPEFESVAKLNSRELSILIFAANGLENEQIARELNCSEFAVLALIDGIAQKLGAKNLLHAIAIAIKHNYI